MIVEAAILDRQHRLTHPFRNLRERHLAPLLTSFTFGHERREQRRFEDHRRQRLPIARPLERLDDERSARIRLALRGRRRRIEDHADDLAVGLAAADHHRDGVAADREFTGPLDGGALRVAEIVEAVDQLPIGEALSAVQFERRAKMRGNTRVCSPCSRCSMMRDSVT